MAAEMSEPTMAKKRKLIKELGFLRETRKGRQRFYLLNLQKMGCLSEGERVGYR